MFENGMERDAIAEKLFSAARMIALVVFGLLPIICIPYVAAAPVGYTKILIAALGGLLALIFFAFATLRSGSLAYRFEWPLIALWAAFLVALISALFSGDFLDSFWGTEVGPHAAVFTGILALTATLWTYLGKSKETVVRLYLFLTGSAVVLAVFHLVRVFFGADFLGLGLFGGNTVLSPLGEWNSLGIFFGLMVILSLVALEQLSLSSAGKAFFVVATGLSLLMLAIINFVAVFMVLAIVSLVMVIYTLTRGKLRPGQIISRPSSSLSVIMSFATLLISIIFVIGGATIGSFVSGMTDISYIEVRPSLEATFGVAKEVYKDQPILGVGPNRFADAWRLHRDPAINSTIFWNTDFQAGYGFIPTIFVTQGLLGALVWIAFLISFLVLGVRTLMRAQDSDRIWYFVAISSLVASLYLWGMSLLYVPSPALLLIAALTTGVFLAARRALMPQSEQVIELMRNQRLIFFTVSATVLVVVASVGSMYYLGRHYASAFVYRDSIISVSRGGSPEAAVGGVVRAFELANDDLYARQIAGYERERMMALLSSNQTGADAQAQFQNSLSSGIQAGQLATQIDPTEPEAWAVLGRVYATVVQPKIEGAYESAKDALEHARALDPKNPSRVLALAELELLNGNGQGARAYINEAIALKSNYTDAMYVLAQLEIAEGNVPAAIESTRATTRLDPQNPVRYFQLGVLELSVSKIPEAVSSLERAVSLSPDYANARYFLAFAYDAAGRRDDARRELAKVLELNPGNQEVTGLLGRLDRGEPLTQAAQTNETIPEQSEDAEGGSVTSGQAPNSPLLTPVNTDTVPSDGE